MIEAKPGYLIGDRAYDSDPLDEELRNDGIEMIAPHRSNRSKPPTQDRRRLSRYMRRWFVERFFAWIQWHRRGAEQGDRVKPLHARARSSAISVVMGPTSGSFSSERAPTERIAACTFVLGTAAKGKNRHWFFSSSAC